MKKHVSLIIYLLICLSTLAGCSCKHTWIDANCVTARTCSVCNMTEGEPLGHSPGQWQETADPIAAVVSDIAVVWCVSLIAIGEADADLRHCLFMACDPLLDKETAYHLDIELSVALLNAASNGESFGYYQNHELLYENAYVPEGQLGAISMNLYNIYASDFR